MSIPLHGLIIQALFIILGLGLFINGYKQSRQKVRMWGTSTLKTPLFIAGKFSLFLCWLLLLLKSIFPELGYRHTTEVLSWIGVGLMAAGTLVMILSFVHLGPALRVGLPDETTALSTRGIYRISRNPMYLGAYVICLASCLYFPAIITVVLALLGMTIHHMIIIGEEEFLEKRFGEEYLTYKKKVRRYI